MPKSDDTSTALRRDLHAHTARIKELRHLVELAQDEIAIHEAVLGLGDNERLVSAINEIGSSETGSRDEIFHDLGQYCNEKDIPIPEGVTFVPASADDAPLPLKAEIRRGRAAMEIIWAPEIGFVGRGLIPQLSFIISAPS